MGKINLKQRLAKTYILKLEKFCSENKIELKKIPNSNLIAYSYAYLKSKEGHSYSVLLEFDGGKPGYGIYYGCKGYNITEEEIEKTDTEWDDYKEEIARVLFGMLNLPKEKQRLLTTDVFDKEIKEYWPFWIKIEESEDISIACKAMAIITKTLIDKFDFQLVK
jgi:hypothetical protein